MTHKHTLPAARLNLLLLNDKVFCVCFWVRVWVCLHCVDQMSLQGQYFVVYIVLLYGQATHVFFSKYSLVCIISCLACFCLGNTSLGKYMSFQFNTFSSALSKRDKEKVTCRNEGMHNTHTQNPTLSSVFVHPPVECVGQITCALRGQWDPKDHDQGMFDKHAMNSVLALSAGHK